MVTDADPTVPVPVPVPVFLYKTSQLSPMPDGTPATRLAVPWVHEKESSENEYSYSASTFAAAPWAFGGFPESVRTFLVQQRLTHLSTVFEGQSIVALALELASSSQSSFSKYLERLGVAKVGDRQRFMGALRRTTQCLGSAAAALVDPSLQQRLTGQVGDNLFAFVSTFPRSESSAVASAAADAISIAGVVGAISSDASAVEALRARLHAQHLSWLSEAQIDLLRVLSVFLLVCILESGLKPHGAIAEIDAPWRRVSEAFGLLPLASATAPWHSQTLCSRLSGSGGALVILSPPRKHLWQNLPPALGVLPAVMGRELRDDEIDAVQLAARRTLTRGEIGILHSNAHAWHRALDNGYEWLLILEDDAKFGPGAIDPACTLAHLVARLPSLVDAASAHEPDWQLLVLSPVNTPYCFFRGTPSECIPHVLGNRQTIRQPTLLSPPEPRGTIRMPPCWQRCPPTYHAFAWVYRRPLMSALLESWSAMDPPPDPLDIWVWEVLAKHEMLGKALCVERPLIDRGNLFSVKDSQDDPAFLQRLYHERGYGTGAPKLHPARPPYPPPNALGAETD